MNSLPRQGWRGELRALVADRLIYWAFRLDPERFIDKDGRIGA